jgi:hypothetical protein
MIDVWVDGGRRRRQALQGGAGEWGGYISIVRVGSYTSLNVMMITSSILVGAFTMIRGLEREPRAHVY